MTVAQAPSADSQSDIQLRFDGYRCLIRPPIGGSVWSFSRDGDPILRDQTGCTTGLVTDSACFPLVPFSNRLRGGRFDFAGLTLRVAANVPGTGRVVHGFGWQSAWSVVTQDAVSATLRHRHEGQNGWPWPYTADQHIALGPAGLAITLSVTNEASSSTMPAGLGLHPYFPRRGDEQLELMPARVFIPDNDGFPSTEDPAAKREWSLPGGGAGPSTVYIEGWQRPARVRRGRAATIAMTASSNATHLVMYAPQGQDSFCVEPVTHAVGALNEPGLSGLRRLSPGETMSLTMTLGPEG